MKQISKKHTFGVMAVILLLLAGPVAIEVMSATFDTSVGTWAMNATPTVSGVDFQTDAYSSDEALDPDASTYQRLNFTVGSAAGISDVLNITIWIYDASTHSANYNTTAEDGIFLTQFLWVEATDTWTVNDQGSMSNWAVDSSNSDDPGSSSSETSSEFSMRFQISQVARADTDWNATVHVYDDDSPTPEIAYAGESTLVTMNNYFNLSFSTSTFTWGTDIQPSSTNNTHDALTLTVLANAQWEIKMSSSNATAAAQTDVTPESNDFLIWDDNDGVSGGISQVVRNTTAVLLGTWDNQAAMNDESGLARNVYIFLNPGALFVVGVTWSVTITCTVQANS